MKAKRHGVRGSTVRRVVQVTALLVFFGLVLATRRGTHTTVGAYLQTFFLLDPLVLVLTWLAAHAVPTALLASLATLVLTMLLGRVFCGWFCPLGTIHALAGRFLRFCWPQRKRPEHWSAWQLTKYYLLGVLLVMALCGVHWGAVFDPLVLLYRTTTVALLPGVQWAAEDGSAAVGLGETGRALLREHVTDVERQAFVGSTLIFALFLTLLGLNRYRPRFWCRYLCPLGALLGVFALRPFLQRRAEPATCNHCDLCGVDCHGAAATGPGQGWQAAECLGCLNCTAHCARGSLGFHFQLPFSPRGKEQGAEAADRECVLSTSAPSPPPLSRKGRGEHGPSRRGFLREVGGGACSAAAGGLAGLFLLRATPQSRGTSGNPNLIRPPGALAEREFLKRCTACGMCMKICPTGCLQPSLSEGGLEGLWTPRAVPRIGRCEYDCTLCGQVCPTGAIARLTVDQKHQVRMGIAVLDHSRCIPYAYGRDCGTCVEACPFPEKAIRMVDVEITVNDGTRQQTKIVSQPMVDPDRCTGCGGCVKECTFKDEPAIRVVAANESRHPGLRPFLDLGPKRSQAATPAGAPATPAAADPYGS